jgi:hypothetical protein
VEKPKPAPVDALIREIQRYLAFVEALRSESARPGSGRAEKD